MFIWWLTLNVNWVNNIKTFSKGIKGVEWANGKVNHLLRYHLKFEDEKSNRKKNIYKLRIKDLYLSAEKLSLRFTLSNLIIVMRSFQVLVYLLLTSLHCKSFSSHWHPVVCYYRYFTYTKNTYIHTYIYMSTFCYTGQPFFHFLIYACLVSLVSSPLVINN